MDQGAAQTQLLLHAAREPAGQAAGKGSQSAEGQQPLTPLATLAAGHSEDIGVEGDILPHGQVRVEAETLAHIADLALDPFGPGRKYTAQYLQPAFLRIEDTGQHAQGGGLAGTVGADQAKELSLGDGEGQAIHGGQLAEATCEVVGCNDFHRY